MNIALIILWCTMSVPIFFLSTVHSYPIEIDFSVCQTSVYPLEPGPDPPTLVLECCPPKPTKPIIDGAPPPSTKIPRVRLASQCTDEVYATKLNQAYALMRALPDDDPRSFTQQWRLHCSYCGGGFLTSVPNSNTSNPIDIHFSWLFYPWHRYYLFFHERILQSLLGDPTFSLNYWNWDSPYTVGDGSYNGGACLKAGQDFPAAYRDSFASTYDANRSQNAKGNGRLHFPDFNFSPFLPAVQQPFYNASAATLIANNLNTMNQAMVENGTTIQTFGGRPYRAGDLKGNPSATGGAGTLEASAHAGVHFWTGLDPPANNDMGQLGFSARDPVFFAHHSNIDRLFTVWKDLGPMLGQNRQYSTDLDYLNATFLFYDENKDLRRVKIGDALDTRSLGYVYQEANDNAWINYKPFEIKNGSREFVLQRLSAILSFGYETGPTENQIETTLDENIHENIDEAFKIRMRD